MALFSRSSQTVPQVDSLPADISLAPNALIAVRNLEKSYAHGTSRTYVLRRINVDVKEGEFISIMGPSGAGKSTLLHIIGMHDSAWTGEYYFLDQPVHKLGKKDLYPNQLSGGQQQLVAVARAVISNPKVILADEPTGNLHTSQGKEIMELFRKLNEAGTTIIQVTHSEANAAYGSRIIQLRDGYLVNCAARFLVRDGMTLLNDLRLAV